jgi:hypothetical protein
MPRTCMQAAGAMLPAPEHGFLDDVLGGLHIPLNKREHVADQRQVRAWRDDIECAGRKLSEMATVMSVEGITFDSGPTRALKADVRVMLQRTRDELPAIQQLWPHFERLVGLRGRRMYAMVTAETYAACTPVREGDDPASLGLDTGTLPGGWYLQARITGEPPGLYERIGPAMQALEALAYPLDPARPLIEYYRRHDVIELWIPVPAQS